MLDITDSSQIIFDKMIDIGLVVVKYAAFPYVWWQHRKAAGKFFILIPTFSLGLSGLYITASRLSIEISLDFP